MNVRGLYLLSVCSLGENADAVSAAAGLDLDVWQLLLLMKLLAIMWDLLLTLHPHSHDLVLLPPALNVTPCLPHFTFCTSLLKVTMNLYHSRVDPPTVMSFLLCIYTWSLSFICALPISCSFLICGLHGINSLWFVRSYWMSSVYTFT